MTKRFLFGGWLLIFLLAAGLAGAQSPRPDISWFAGGHPQVISVAYSPDGKILASSGHFDDSVKLWDAASGRMVRTLRTNGTGSLFIFGPMVPLVFFPDGKTILALGEAAGPAFWNAADGSLVRKLGGTNTDFALNADASLLAVASSSSLRLLRPNDGSLVRTITWPGNFLQAVAFSRDGSIVAGGDRDGVLKTFRVSDGAPLLNIPAHTDFINALAYSPDGAQIATGSSDRTIKFWNAISGQPMGTLSGHTDWVNTIAFSPNGEWLASGSTDESVKLWSLPSQKLATTLGQNSSVNAVNFNPTSTRLAVGAYNELREYDVPGGALVRNLIRASGQISGTLFTPDNTKLVSTSYDGKVSIADAATGALLNQFTAAGSGGSIFCLGLNADMIAVGMNSPNGIRVYRFSDGALLHTLIPGGLAYPRSAVFSPDGATLATGHFTNTVRLWNLADGTLVRTLNSSESSGDMFGLAYTSDGSRLIGASSDGLIRVWDAKGNLVRTMGTSGQSRSSLSISPDNQIALAGGSNGVVQLWRISDGALVDSVNVGASVTQVAFTPSGLAFYAVLGNGAMRVFRAADHQLLESYSIEVGEGPGGISGVGQITSLGLSPDGKYVAFGRDEATVVTAYNTLIAAPTSGVASTGQIVKGSFQDLVLPDGAALMARPAGSVSGGSAPLQIDLTAHPALSNSTSLAFQILVTASVDRIRQEIWMRNAKTGEFERVDGRWLTADAQTIRVDLGRQFARYIDPSGQVSAQVKYFPDNEHEAPWRDWEIRIDQAVWAAGL